MRIKRSIAIAFAAIVVTFCIASAMAQGPVATTFSYGAQWGPGGKPEMVQRWEAFYRAMGNRTASIFFEDYGVSRDWDSATQTPSDISYLFTSSARRVYCWNSVSQASPGTSVVFKWFSPRGTLVSTATETIAWSGYGWVTGSLNLESVMSTISEVSGVWRVDVLVENEVIHQQSFAIDTELPLLNKPRVSRGGFLGCQSSMRQSTGVFRLGSSALASLLRPTRTDGALQTLFARAQFRAEDANGATIWIPLGNLAQQRSRTNEEGETEVDFDMNIPVGIVSQGRFPADLVKITTRDSQGNLSVWPNFEVH